MKIELNAEFSNAVECEIESRFEEFVSMRRHIHMYPEVGMETGETEAFVKKQLDRLNVKILPSNVGVMALIPGKNHDHIVALRADMDALPLKEESGLPFSSKHEGKMHACGHDMHTAMLLGCAEILNNHRECLEYDVLLIFQPCEEGPILSGAKEMIPELERLGLKDKIAVVFGQHVFNSLDTGKAGFRFGSGSASTDVFKLTFIGSGGHCCNPHKNIDALSLGAKFVSEMESFMSRRMDPMDNAICSIGTFHSGTANNIVPETATLTASIRCQREETRGLILEHVDKIAAGICHGWDADYELEASRGLPVLQNDSKTVDYAIEVSNQILGEDKTVMLPYPMMGAEDFSYFSELFPVAFITLGARNCDKGCDGENHNPHVRYDEEVIRTGVKMFCNLAANYK